MQLQEQLTTTENQISFSRQHYNATVLDYNNTIQTFPAVVFAGLFGFTKREFFDAEPEAQAVPTVDLSLSSPRLEARGGSAARRSRARRPMATRPSTARSRRTAATPSCSPWPSCCSSALLGFAHRRRGRR